eukprot:799912-Prorocentrum_minimum.AAC.3
MCHAALVAARSLLDDRSRTDASMIEAEHSAASSRRFCFLLSIMAAGCTAVRRAASRRLRAATSAAWHIGAEGAAS